MTRVIEGSAPSKAIIVGEHFVVRDQPAIAAALNIRTYVKAKEHSHEYIRIISTNLGIDVKIDMRLSRKVPSDIVPFVRILEIIRERFDDLRPCLVIISSEIPVGSGMGSSASTFTAFTAAYLKFIDIEVSLDEISKIAYEAECIVHGKPSGIDNTITTYGGVIAYRKSEGFLRINAKLSEEYVWLIADTGVRRSTGDLVRKVLELYDKYVDIFMPLYHAAGHLAIEAGKALQNGDYVRLGELMNINQGMLSAIGVSTLQIEEIVYKARSSGALGAKLTGAGGGGAVLILAKRCDATKIKNAVRPYARQVLETNISPKGVEVKVIS